MWRMRCSLDRTATEMFTRLFTSVTTPRSFCFFCFKCAFRVICLAHYAKENFEKIGYQAGKKEPAGDKSACGSALCVHGKGSPCGSIGNASP